MSQPRGRDRSYIQSLGSNDPDRKTPGHDWILLDWLTKDRLLELGRTWYPPTQWTPEHISGLTEQAAKSAALSLHAMRAKVDSETRRLNGFVQDHATPDHRLAEQRKLVDSLEHRVTTLAAWTILGEPPESGITITAVRDAHPIYEDWQRSKRPVIYIDRLVNFKRTLELSIESGVQRDEYDGIKWHTPPTWHVASDAPSVAFEVKTRIPSYSELIQQLQTYRGFLPRDSVRLVVVCPDALFKAPIEDQGFTFLQCPAPPAAKSQTSLFE